MRHWPILLLALVFLSQAVSPAVGGEDNLTVTFDGDRVTIVADGVPLRHILARLAGEGKTAVYLAKRAKNEPITVHLERVRLEKALAKLLADYSYAVSIRETDGRQHLTTLKVYPKGSASGALEPIAPAPAATAEETGERAPAMAAIPPAKAGTGTTATEGEVAPGAVAVTPAAPATEADPTTDPVAAMRLDFQAEQQRLYKEQLELQRRMDATTDPEQREALAMALAAQAERLKELQLFQTNKLEAVRRLRALKDEAVANDKHP